MADKKESQEAMASAMAVLDDLEKSNETDDGLDELIKSLEEEAELLAKSDDGNGDDGGGNDGDGDGDGDGGGGDGGGDGEPVDKSMDDDFAAELIKASEAYASLEKSVSEGMEGVNAEITNLGDDVASLTKSVSSLLALSVKQAKVIGGLVKSVQAMGSHPVGASRTKLGIGSQDDGNNDGLKKSVSEVSDLLLKAVQDKKVDAQWLTTFGVYKNTDMLPDDVKQAIGI